MNKRLETDFRAGGPGWYWFRSCPETRWTMVEVWQEDETGGWLMSHERAKVDEVMFPDSYSGAEYLGPIPEPGDDLYLAFELLVADGTEELSIVPSRLTAENGAKGLLSGEFFEKTPAGDEIPVSWTNIKKIHEMIVSELSR